MEPINSAPKDRYHVVYLTFLLQGMGMLLPWNMFITAVDYFTNYKLHYDYIGRDYNGRKTLFLQYLTLSSQIPNVLFNWFNVFMQLRGNLTGRILCSISGEIILFLFTIVLAMVDSSTWPSVFFWLTIATVVVLNSLNAVYESSVYGKASTLPPHYIGGIVLGNNISGTFASLISIFSSLSTPNFRLQAIYYFIIALFVLLICFDTYYALPINRCYRYHELMYKKEKENNMQSGDQNNTGQRIPYLRIFRQTFCQNLNVFTVFFVTLSLFPAVQANIRKSEDTFFINEKFYSPITCFLSFNVCAMLGSLLSNYFLWPPPKYVCIPVNLRFLYIPFYLFCNYQLYGVTRSLPVYIKSDWLYWIIGMTMAFSSGYWSSVSLQYVPMCVEPQHAATAGMFACAVLITGIFTGILSTFIWPKFIQHIKF